MTPDATISDAHKTGQNEIFSQALALHQQGDLERAEQLYKAILSLDPHHPDALHLLGLIAQAKGHYDQARQLIEGAIGQDSRQPLFYNNLGNVLLDDGQFESSIQAFITARRIDPGFDEALYNLANAYQKAKQIDKAITCYETYLEGHPGHAEAHYNLGKALITKGALANARKSFKQALKSKPQFFDALIELAGLLRLEKDWEAALNKYNQALALRPDDAGILNAIGGIYQIQGKINNAIQSYRSALNRNPLHKKTFVNLFKLLCSRGFDRQATDMVSRMIQAFPDFVEGYLMMGGYHLKNYNLDKAGIYLRQAIALDATNANAHNLLGLTHSEKGELSTARHHYRQAIKNLHQPVGALNNLGRDLVSQGRYQAGIACIKTALNMSKKLPDVHSNLLYFNHYADRVTQQELFSIAEAWWNYHGKPLKPIRHSNHDRSTERQLRIGYVSPDFRRHSVSYFFFPLLKSHNRNKFHIICYSQVHRPDEVTEKIARLSDGWCSTTGLSDEVLAKQIQKDKIDILVDLAGHTGHNRLTVLARRPAPVQINWLGYPNTSGLPVMDYRLTDAIADPEPDADRWHTEKLIRLSKGFLCFLPPKDAPEIDPLWDFNDRPVTFGSFNNLAKINKKVVALWSEILQAVPDSILVLKSRPLADGSTRERYFRLFAKGGIARGRVKLLPATRSLGEHLGMYNQIAIGLDPLPYNGTTTTFEALYMGVPVVTLLGDRHSARVGASILTRIGLTDLIAHREESYIRKAVELAKNRELLLNMRSTIRKKLLSSDLCDRIQFAAQMETIYRQVWKQWCQQ